MWVLETFSSKVTLNWNRLLARILEWYGTCNSFENVELDVTKELFCHD
jgi:hypothetical protein